MHTNEPDKEDKQQKKTSSSSAWGGLAQVSQMGVTMAVSVLLGVVIGKYLDDFFHTSPWLLIFFSLLGMGAALKYVFDMK